MNCICGKPMHLLGTLVPSTVSCYAKGCHSHEDIITLWVCPPEGCGRIFMEGSEEEHEGTWYQAEVNQSSRRIY